MVEVKTCRVTAAVVGALALAVLLPNIAQAATFCVQNPQCVANGGSERGTLPAAVIIANSVPGHDVIEVGPGRIAFAGPAIDASGNDGVEIIGRGRGETTLVASPGANDPVITLNAESAVVKDLRIAMPDGASFATALALPSGAVENVHLFTEGSVAGQTTAIDATTDMSDVSIRNVKIDWPLSNKNASSPVGIAATPNGPDVVSIQNAEISAAYAVAIQPKNNGRVSIDHLGATASIYGVLIGCTDAQPCSTDLSNSRIALRTFPKLGEDSIGQGVALAANGATNSAPVLSTDHVSISLDGDPSVITTGVLSIRGSFDLQNTVINGGTFSLSDQSPRSTDHIHTISSAYDRSTISDAGFGDLQETAPLDVDPRFVDRAAGDLRLRYDSPLIDSATDSVFGIPASSSDLLGKLRTVDGNGDGSARSDIGAHEYQRQAPSITAKAIGARARAGSPVTFTASGSDPDPGDTLSYRWEFSDGTSASGAGVSKVFSKAGTQTGKVTVTDPTGLRASATATIGVEALPCTNAGVARTKSIKLRGTRLRFGITPSSLHVGSTAKVTLDLAGRGRKLKAAVRKLKRSLRTVELRNGKKLITKLSATKRTRSFSTAKLKPGTTTLTIRVVPKRGKSHTLKTKIKLAPRC